MMPEQFLQIVKTAEDTLAHDIAEHRDAEGLNYTMARELNNAAGRVARVAHEPMCCCHDCMRPER